MLDKIIMTLKRRKVAILILGIIFFQILINSQLNFFDKPNQIKPVNEDNYKIKLKSSSILIFEDDFESYPVNTFPTGYTLTYNGAGNSYQKITDTQAVSGSQSFTLKGRDNWMATADKTISYTSNILTLEAYLMSETPTGIVEGGQDNSNMKLTFANPNLGSWGRHYASLVLNNDGRILLASVSPYIDLGAYTPFTWYHLKMVVNISGWSVKVYLDSTYMGESSILNDPSEITHVRIISAHQGVTGYIDDIIFSEDSSSSEVFNITINTPENKTYTEPMSGYYPATYGFENGNLGDDPAKWAIDEAAGTIQIISELDGHKNIVEFYDNSGTNDVSINNNFIAQVDGTIELWVRISDTTDSIVFELSDIDGGTVAFQAQIRYDIIRAIDAGNGWQTLVAPALDNKWYHIRWDFNCTNGTFDIYIDGELKGSDYAIVNGIASISHINIRTSNTPTNYYTYLDAIGYSWDPSYDVLDNYNEGLLLSFNNNTYLDWIGYSLNDQINKTILGNTTILMPNEGIHNIRVFGNDSLGTIYKSDLRYFTVDFTPEPSNGWLYYRELNINPATPEIDYQIKVQLNTSNFNYPRASPDGSDIRFFDGNQIFLNYWIENWDTSGTSVIWVKIPDLGTTYIYMYYGNSNATSLSNGTNTFVFFDDFEGTNLDTSKWNEDKTTRSGTFTVTVEDSLVKVLMSNFDLYSKWTAIGWHDYYTTGGIFGDVTPNGIDIRKQDTRTHTEGGTAQVFSGVAGAEWEWLVQDIYYVNSSLVQFYENGTLISTHDDSASFPPIVGEIWGLTRNGE